MIGVTLDFRDFPEIRARLMLYEVWRAGRLTWSEADNPDWAPTDDERTALAVYEFVTSLPDVVVTLADAAAQPAARGKAPSRVTTTKARKHG